MAQQTCLPVADGYYTAWTGDYTAWAKVGGTSPAISTITNDAYESAILATRAVRASLQTSYVRGWSYKNDNSWILNYGLAIGASGLQFAGNVTVDTFGSNNYQNMALNGTSEAQIDNASLATIVLRVTSAGTAYVPSQYLEHNYTPPSGGFMLILSFVAAAIGAGLGLAEMPQLARHVYLETNRPQWLRNAAGQVLPCPTRSGYGLHREDYEPAWREWLAFRHPVHFDLGGARVL